MASNAAVVPQMSNCTSLVINTTDDIPSHFVVPAVAKLTITAINHRTTQFNNYTYSTYQTVRQLSPIQETR